MPHSFRLEQIAGMRVVSAKLWGDVTLEEVADAQKELKAQPWFDPDLPLILDVSASDLAALSSHDIGRMGRGRSAFSPRSVHILVAEADVVFGLSRMLSTIGEMSGRPETIVVRSMAEAREAV